MSKNNILVIEDEAIVSKDNLLDLECGIKEGIR